jgi:aminoglycoside phosphotransferase (APT) family kinase protein
VATAIPQTADVDAPTARALALVPGLEQGAVPLAVQRLQGGSVNHVWRVDTSAGRFVLRSDAPLSRRPGVDRERERQLHTLAAQAGIAPRIVARTASGDGQVTEYVDARAWQSSDYADVTQLVRLGITLAQLHSIQAPSGVAPFAAYRLAREYAAAGAAVAAAPHTAAAQAATLCAAIAQAESRLADRQAPLCLVHGDPTAGNVLDNRRLWLIDWEYAQCAEPLFDIAAVLVYYPEARAHRNALLAAANQSAAAQNGGLAAAAVIHAALGWLWHYARGEIPVISAGISAPEWAN